MKTAASMIKKEIRKMVVFLFFITPAKLAY